VARVKDAPKDVPLHVSRDDNCRVYVCIWAYIIY